MKTVSVPTTRSVLFRVHPLTLAVAFALPAAAQPPDAAPEAVPSAISAATPSCPIGAVRCAPRKADWSLCKPGDLFDFYLPDLPRDGDRNAAPTDITAQNSRSADGNRFELQGEARVQQHDQLIRADAFSYERDTTAWTAEGHVRYQDRSLLLSADRGSGRTEPSQSTLENVRYQLIDARGNGAAATATMPDQTHAHLTGSTFTTCDLDAPQWHFAVRDLTLDQDEGVGRGRDVTFHIGDVPVFWLPYARFPLDDRRVSGFLYPTIGYSNQRGFDLTLPYYLNLAPNYDATLYPRLMTHRGLMLGGEFRYLTAGSSGELDFTYLPDDRDADRDRGLFHWRNATVFNANWGAAIDLNHASDDRYFEDFGRSLNMAATSLLPSSAYLNGRGTWWTASFGADRYQITDPELPGIAEPYRRLPRATFEGEKALFGGLDWGVKSEFVAFSKDDALDGQRLDLYPYLAYPIERAGWFVRPEIGYRYTTYNLDRDQDDTPDRGVPIYSLDVGLIFERGFTLGDHAWTQTLEPRLYYLRVPYRNQDDIPIFDTQIVPFTFGQMFRTNSFVGADRQADANNLTLALTTRVLDDATGDERLSASIGQIRYFDEQRVQLPGVAPTDWNGSAYVGNLTLSLNPRWRLTVDQQWNPNSDRTDLSAVGVQHRFGAEGVLNLSYRFRRGFIEQADASALIPIGTNWRIVARNNYSLNESKTLERFVGLERDSCCTAWRVIAREWVRNVEGELDKALFFEIEFKGVGAFGQRSEDFLTRAVRGYQSRW